MTTNELDERDLFNGSSQRCQLNISPSLFEDLQLFLFYTTPLPGTLINILVILLGIRLLRKCDDPIHIFIISMSLADLITTSIIYPIELASESLKNDKIIIRIFSILSRITSVASCFSLTLLTIDKFLLFAYPLRYPVLMENQKARRLCYYAWICSIGYSFLMETLLFNPTERQSLFVICVIPTYLTLMLSFYMAYVVKIRREESHSDRSAVNSVIFIFVTAAWTAFTVFLFAATIFTATISTLLIHFDLSCEFKALIIRLLRVGTVAFSTNAVGNPFITLLINPSYRKELGDYFRKRRRIDGIRRNFRREAEAQNSQITAV